MIRRLSLVLSLIFGATLALCPVQARDKDRTRIVVVTHGAATDPFWASVKEGAEQAAKDLGVELDYRAPPTFDLEAMAKLVTEAVAEKPDGIVTSIPNADALAAPLRSAVEAGIPLISINSGFDIAASLGSRLHVGQSEYDAGKAVGEEMKERGGTKALCINHELGNVALDLRCKGFIDGFGGSVEVLPVEPDPAKIKAAIEEKLQADKALDVILALNASLAGEPAIGVVRAAGRSAEVRVATFDLTDAVLHAVADGSAAFAVDQQPFLQGYLPIQYLVLLRRHGVIPVSNVATGPRLLNAEDAADRLTLREQSTD
jgi:simple sugar transport system substrate-binding protein